MKVFYCKGAAMENRLAPVIPILYLHIIETKALDLVGLKPFLFKRFIDDCFGIWKGDLDSLHQFLKHMNSIHPNIKFTMETHLESGRLNFLRFSLRTANGIIDRKLSTKPSRRPVFKHAESHHLESLNS